MADHRAALHAALSRLPGLSATARAEAIADLVTADSVWHGAHPIGDLIGAPSIEEGWFSPLRRALPGLMRRDEIAIGGLSRTGSGHWFACLGHYVGNFALPLFGIAPHGKLVFVRYGEFYRVIDGRIAEAFLLPDLLDLKRQAGRTTLTSMLGTEMLFPAPATHDGICPARPDRSEGSVRLVEAMLSDLHHYHPATFASAGQTGERGYWHRDMLWFGPAGIGSNFTYAGFDRDHRVPFLTAFPDRQGGNHFARFGDGDYVCSGGWPSMTMTHLGPYLGVPPTGRALTLRVMDFWRVGGEQIAENWVLLDLLDLFAQMGVDLLAA